MYYCVHSLNTVGSVSILDEQGLEEIVKNWCQCGKLREQVFSTFSSPCFGLKQFITKGTDGK
jgi:hypothetical protein